MSNYTKKDIISAILTPPQQDSFKKEFGINPNDLEPNIHGYAKHVLLSEDKVWLFGRNHVLADRIKNEQIIYKWIADNKININAPVMLDIVNNQDVSPYDIMIVKRLFGNSVYQSLLDKSFTITNLKIICDNLAEQISIWHGVNILSIEKEFKIKDLSKSVDNENWQYYALNSDKLDIAVEYIYNWISNNLSKYEIIENLPPKEITTKVWKKSLYNLSSLDHVLVHGDLHEGQVLINNSNFEITGIMDWELSEISNPVLEFNFNEWGKEVWARFLPEIHNIRASMWSIYCSKRGIENISEDDLNLFYFLWYSFNIPKWYEMCDDGELDFVKMAETNIKMLIELTNKKS